MKRKVHIWGLLCLMLFFHSCGIFRDKNLAKRYRNTSNLHTFANSVNPQLFVQVDLHSILINEPTNKEVKFNLLSLSDKGQEAFINSANAKSSNATQLMDILNNNFSFSKESKSKIKIIPKTIKKTLIFTVDRLQYHFDPGNGTIPPTTTFNNLGDRISYLELKLNLSAGSNAIFNSWDKYVTDKITLNLGKVSSAQNWNASLNISAKGIAETSLSGSNTNEDFISDKGVGSTTLVNTGATGTNTNVNGYELISTDKGTDSKTNSAKISGELGGSATVGYSDKYETSLDLSSQILKLSGTIAESSILLRQEGGPGIDLSGNIVVSLEYVLNHDWAPPVQFIKFNELHAKSGRPISLDTLNDSFLTVIFPDITQNITGEMNYSFLYRQVNKGNRHLPEARQKVKYRYGNVNYTDNTLTNRSAVNLIRPQDVRPKAYVIRANGMTNNLAYNGVEMQFESISEATLFLSYISDLIQNTMPITRLSLGTAVLTSASFRNLRIITLQL